jgi:tetratricopeptide (TPR) repeat protein
MRTAWLRTLSAVFCIVGLSATCAVADPFTMAAKRRQPEEAPSKIWPWSKDKEVAAATPPQVAARPSQQVSAKKHPIKYLKSKVPDIHIGSKGKDASAQRLAQRPAAAKQDSISLNTPSGPPSAEFFIFAAQMCERQGDIPQARNNFQRALAMWPGHVEVLRAAARMEDRQGNLPLAENLYQQAVTANPQHAGAFNDLGLCLARQGKLDPSLQVLEQAVQLQPAKSLYRNNAATVLVEMRQDQRALAHLAAVHGAADANYNIGQLLVQRGRSADAAPYFQAALQQKPDMQVAQDALAKLQGAQVTVSTPPTAQAPMVSQAPVQPGPAVLPQQAWPTAPQPTYPQTARAPATEASSSVAPRYLPPVPVASRPGAPGAMVR